LVSCQKCGYAFARTSTRTSARKIHYYKCIGSDGWRKLGGPVCNNGRLVRQDLLDQIVWDEVIRLLEDPTLIQQELDRRLEAARSSNPTKKREQNLQRELAHVGKGIERPKAASVSWRRSARRCGQFAAAACNKSSSGSITSYGDGLFTSGSPKSRVCWKNPTAGLGISCEPCSGGNGSVFIDGLEI
jgi:hypothetical protein